MHVRASIAAPAATASHRPRLASRPRTPRCSTTWSKRPRPTCDATSVIETNVWSTVTFISSWLRETPPPVVKGRGGDLTAIVLGALAALIIMNLHMYLFGVAIVG